MTTLYSLTDEYTEALKVMQDAEIDNQTILDTLEGLSGDVEAKGKNVAAFLQNLESDAKAMKDAENRIAVRRKTIENKVAHMKEYLRANMEKCDITEISCPEFVVKLGKPSAICQIDDESKLTSEYVVTKTTHSADKRLILKDLKADKDVPGASLAYGKSKLTIK